MSTADAKVVEIIQAINLLIKQRKLEEAEAKLKDLDYWYSYSKYWD